jgi:ClpP protease-like protein
MGSVVLQAASEGKRLTFPHSWIMIHEPAKWAGWQSTTAAAQHLERLKQMQDQIYKILSLRSGKRLRQIIRDTKRNDFYLDAQKALDYGLVDAIVAGELKEQHPIDRKAASAPASPKQIDPNDGQPPPPAKPVDGNDGQPQTDVSEPAAARENEEGRPGEIAGSGG